MEVTAHIMKLMGLTKNYNKTELINKLHGHGLAEVSWGSWLSHSHY